MTLALCIYYSVCSIRALQKLSNQLANAAKTFVWYSAWAIRNSKICKDSTVHLGSLVIPFAVNIIMSQSFDAQQPFILAWVEC